MSITIFRLPTYKDMAHVSEVCYLDGKAYSCHGTELEDFLPIWRKLTTKYVLPCTLKEIEDETFVNIRPEVITYKGIDYIGKDYWGGFFTELFYVLLDNDIIPDAYILGYP